MVIWFLTGRDDGGEDISDLSFVLVRQIKNNKQKSKKKKNWIPGSQK